MKLYLLICVVIFPLSPALHAQSHVVRGTVFSDKIGQAVAGVSVRSGKATVQTDSKGRFSISASEGDTLQFSRYGFRARRVLAGREDTLNVTLSAHKIMTPYGTADEERFAGSAVLIQPDFWQHRSFTNLLGAFQGAGTGIQTTLPLGDPGSDPGIRIRGTSLLASAVPPLYIVDGVEFTGSFSDLNPDDIESITVLKDALSSTLYGSRGVNGVVMITTRTGARRKGTFDFSMEFGTVNNGVPGYNTVGPAGYYELSWLIYKYLLLYREGLWQGTKIMPIMKMTLQKEVHGSTQIHW